MYNAGVALYKAKKEMKKQWDYVENQEGKERF